MLQNQSFRSLAVQILYYVILMVPIAFALVEWWLIVVGEIDYSICYDQFVENPSLTPTRHNSVWQNFVLIFSNSSIASTAFLLLLWSLIALPYLPFVLYLWRSEQVVCQLIITAGAVVYGMWMINLIGPPSEQHFCDRTGTNNHIFFVVAPATSMITSLFVMLTYKLIPSSNEYSR